MVNICYGFFKLLFKRFNIDLFAISPKLGVRRTNANKIQVKLPPDLSTETGLKSFCKEVDDILSMYIKYIIMIYMHGLHHGCFFRVDACSQEVQLSFSRTLRLLNQHTYSHQQW